MVLWDPAGQERFESITNNYVRQLDGVVLAFDVTNINSFENILKWFKQIRDISDKPLVIAGNKCDLEDSQVSEEDMKTLEEKLQIRCFFTSAVTGENIEPAIMTLIGQVL